MAGSLVLDTRQERRRLSGNLDISELDFGKLLVKPGRNRASAPAPSTPPSATPLLRRRPHRPPSPPSVKQARDRGWSDDPINLSILGSARCQSHRVRRTPHLQGDQDRPEPLVAGAGGRHRQSHARGRRTLRWPRARPPDARRHRRSAGGQQSTSSSTAWPCGRCSPTPCSSPGSKAAAASRWRWPGRAFRSARSSRRSTARSR